MKRLKDFFCTEQIEYYGAAAYEACFVTREKFLSDRYHAARVSLFSFAVPYYYPDESRNISVYAVPKDYHLYFEGLYHRMMDYFSVRFPENTFRMFADISPFDERALAARCGIGTVGQNGLLINEKYGSYIFIGSAITDLPLEVGCTGIAQERRRCIGCGLCRKKCPSAHNCLSLITQTKGKLTEEQQNLIRENGSAWGCDICQQVCPANREPLTTPITFFKRDRLSVISCDLINTMTDEEFASRAFAWKGRDCILRNLDLLEDGKHEKQSGINSGF